MEMQASTTRTSRRDQLITVTAELLLENGLAATRTRDVTDRSGVGTGLLNHYFRWPELRGLAWSQIFAGAINGQFPTDLEPKKALEHFIASSFDSDAPAYWRLWLEAVEVARTDTVMAQCLQKTEACLLNQLEGLLIAGVKGGDWSLPSPSETTLRLLALHDGLIARLLAVGAQLTPKQAISHIRTAFELECRTSPAGVG